MGHKPPFKVNHKNKLTIETSKVQVSRSSFCFYQAFGFPYIMLLVQISFHADFSVFTVFISRIYSRIRRNLPADTFETGIVVFN